MCIRDRQKKTLLNEWMQYILIIFIEFWWINWVSFPVQIFYKFHTPISNLPITSVYVYLKLQDVQWNLEPQTIIFILSNGEWLHEYSTRFHETSHICTESKSTGRKLIRSSKTSGLGALCTYISWHKILKRGAHRNAPWNPLLLWIPIFPVNFNPAIMKLSKNLSEGPEILSALRVLKTMKI